MKFIVSPLLLILTVLNFSCSNSNGNTATSTSAATQEKPKRSSRDFAEKHLYGKWRFIEDYGAANEREQGHIVFRKDNSLVFIDKSADIEESNYAFEEEAKILSVWQEDSEEKEKLVVEVLNFNEILIKGEHKSGNAFVTKLIRVE